MLGRLNAFQLSMLQWNDLHPYNAVHVVRIPGALEFERLKNVITMTLEGKGLTGLVLDRRAGTYQYHGGPAYAEIKLVGADAASSPGFAEEVERQLNTPFAHDHSFNPFRFMVVAEKDAFSLGLVYFHPIADAESIVFLLKDMVDAYRGRVNPGLATLLERYPARRDKVLRYLAAETGGLAFFPFKVEDLSQSFENIANELRHQYSIFYRPDPLKTDGLYHTVIVRVKDRKGMVVRARKGYYAPRM